MNRLRGTVIAIFAAGALTCAALAMAQAGKPAPAIRHDPMVFQAPNETLATGVNVVRLINTAEMEYKRAQGSYATWDVLFRSGLISDLQKRPFFGGVHLAAGPEAVPGWTLALIPSAEGQSYELSLRNLGDKCQFSFFSDQRGLIYEGQVIGCEAVEAIPAHH